MSVVMNFEHSLPWYHGSPSELTSIRAGSTITQKIELARIFSHKPTIVSVSDDGQIKHNGTTLGYLYVVAEEVRQNDVSPHPLSTMAPGDEWLTKRDMRVQFLNLVEILPEEQLSPADIAALQQLIDERRKQER
jgi:hypothetical protein